MSIMVDSHILPIPAASGNGPLIVVEVKKQGSEPLDITLSGSEGENPYVTTIKQRDIQKLKRKFKGNDEEWELILSHFLLQKPIERQNAKILDGVEMIYSFEGDDIKIIIRRHVDRIKVTLGEFTLSNDPEFEINPFEWAQTAAQAHSSTLDEIAQLKIKFNEQQQTVDKLNNQLQDLIKTKENNENAMLEQFKELLNEKKKKIRDQQRLLAGARVDNVLASNVQSTREESRSRRAGPSRTSKRKANGKAAVVPPESESEEFEQMQVDETHAEAQRAQEEEMPEAVTPDRTTDADTEDEDGSVPSSSVPKQNFISAATDNANESVSQQTKQVKEPPPRRELPFSKPATRSQKPSQPEEDDDDTEDEEL